MSSALESGFKGPVIHSSEFAARMDDVLAAVPAIGTSEKKADVLPVVVVGGGKSAQEYVPVLLPFPHLASSDVVYYM